MIDPSINPNLCEGPHHTRMPGVFSGVLATSRTSFPAHIAHHLVELEPFDVDQSRELIAGRLAQHGWRARPDTQQRGVM